MFTERKRTILLAALAFAAGLGANLVLAADWVGPPGNPPTNNIEPPINAGLPTQYKRGALGVGGIFHAFSNIIVDGNLGFTADETGAIRLNVPGRANIVELCLSGDCRNSWPSSSTVVSGGKSGTTYSADGTSLALTGTTFSVKDSGITSVKIKNGEIVFADWASNSCANGQIPKYDGTKWACAADNGGGGQTYTAGAGLKLTGSAFSLSVNNGSAQTCPAGQKVSALSTLGIVTCSDDLLGTGGVSGEPPGGLTGQGTAGKIAKFSSSASLTDSALTEDQSGNVLSTGAFGVNGLLRAYGGAQVDGPGIFSRGDGVGLNVKTTGSGSLSGIELATPSQQWNIVVNRSGNTPSNALIIAPPSGWQGLYIKNNGNVGIGGSQSKQFNSGDYRLDVAGDANAARLCIAGDCRNSWPSPPVSQWATSGTNIHYNGGSVGIGTTDPKDVLHVKGGDIAVDVTGEATRPRRFTFVNTQQTPPDTAYIEVLPSASRMTIQSPGSGGKLEISGSSFSFQRENSTLDTFSTDVIKLSSYLQAEDVNLSAPKWSSTGSELQAADTGASKGNIGIDQWIECPNGYFISALRFGGSPKGNAVPIVKCSKL